MSHAYGDSRPDTMEDRKEKLKKLNLSVNDLFDWTKPWILVPEGSMLGYFNWVPKELRVGPWVSIAPAYVFAMVYAVCLLTIAVGAKSRAASSMSSSTHEQQGQEDGLVLLDYSGFGTFRWWYNCLGFFWMLFVSCLILVGPAGLNAWGTYTLWSWTILCVRHGLMALSPFLSSSSTLFVAVTAVVEFLRFPAIAMATITFVVWNFLLFPFIYIYFMDSPAKKKNFLKYFTSFKLIQLHVVNIFLAYGNVVVASPPRPLVLSDLVAALIIGVLYVLWYVLVLDRIGVHVYPIFSPRSHWLVLTWSLSWMNYLGSFYFWKSITE